MKIVFIGAVEFSEECLKTVVAAGGDVVGVYTLRESSLNADFRDLTALANSLSVQSFYFDNINAAETVSAIRGLEADIIFCFGISQLLKSEILNACPMGVVGYHPAELPQNRGRHPVIWAIALGLQHTASTFFFMDEGADSGDILSQKRIAIDGDEDAHSLYTKITKVAQDQIREFMPALRDGKYEPIPQKHSEATYWRKRSHKDGLIDWRMGASTIVRLVRALTHPYVGASFMANGNEIKVWRAEVEFVELENVEPGKILAVESGCFSVKCGDYAVRVVEIDSNPPLGVGDYL